MIDTGSTFLSPLSHCTINNSPTLSHQQLPSPSKWKNSIRRTLHHKRNHPQTQRVRPQQSNPQGKRTANRPATDAPQIIAHRGFKRKYPENSLSSFRGAVEADSNAIELDLALSKDNVVVISHVRRLGIYISRQYSVLTWTGCLAETLLRGEQTSR